MNAVAEKQYQHIGESKGMPDHDHDLVHELSKRLDAVWRMDQYIANATEKPHLREFWEKVKDGEQALCNRLRELITKEVKDDCF